jgi:hypothetical protein
MCSTCSCDTLREAAGDRPPSGLPASGTRGLPAGVVGAGPLVLSAPSPAGPGCRRGGGAPDPSGDESALRILEVRRNLPHSAPQLRASNQTPRAPAPPVRLEAVRVLHQTSALDFKQDAIYDGRASGSSTSSTRRTGKDSQLNRASHCPVDGSGRP